MWVCMVSYVFITASAIAFFIVFIIYIFYSCAKSNLTEGYASYHNTIITREQVVLDLEFLKEGKWSGQRVKLK